MLSNTERHKVAGTYYRQEDIEALGILNDDYEMTAGEAADIYDPGTRIYEYVFDVTGKLVPEPDNPHDPKAIRVEADGVLIGYIKGGSTSHVHKLINGNRIIKTQVDIYGGNYHELTEIAEGRYRMIKDSTEYKAIVTLQVRP